MQQSRHWRRECPTKKKDGPKPAPPVHFVQKESCFCGLTESSFSATLEDETDGTVFTAASAGSQDRDGSTAKNECEVNTVGTRKHRGDVENLVGDSME